MTKTKSASEGQNVIGYGLCHMCGNVGDMHEKRANTAHNYACSSCGATLRFRALAHGYISRFGKGQARSLDEALRRKVMEDLDILDFSLQGPAKRRLSRLPGFVNAYYYEDMELGEVRDGVICQDITQMTFADNSFDLITTSDVMEHVDRPWEGFADVHRVLKPGGSYIFTIPIRYPFREKSETRATLDREAGKITHIQKPIYHVSGLLDKTLVFTDFGADLFDKLKDIGLATSFITTSTANEDASRFGVFVATKAST